MNVTYKRASGEAVTLHKNYEARWNADPKLQVYIAGLLERISDLEEEVAKPDKALRKALEQIAAILANVPEKGFWAWQANARADALRIATQSLVAAPKAKP